MTLEDFVVLVRQLREAQKRYFRTRTPICLADSKNLEREVDKAIEEFYAQPGLFPK